MNKNIVKLKVFPKALGRTLKKHPRIITTGIAAAGIAIILVSSQIIDELIPDKEPAKNDALLNNEPTIETPVLGTPGATIAPIETDEEMYDFLSDQLETIIVGTNSKEFAKEEEKETNNQTTTTIKVEDTVAGTDNRLYVSEEDAKVGEQLGADGISVTTEGNYYTAPDNSVWTSESEYKESLNPTTTGSTVTEGNYYTAPDGSVWVSEAEYNTYKSTTSSTYTAPDGSLWASEAEYNTYVAGNTTISEPVETTTTIDANTIYIAPDGSAWTSEAEYNIYAESVKEATK